MHGLTTGLENGQAFLVVPVVQHIVDQVGICPTRHLLEETSPNQFTSLFQSFQCHKVAHLINDKRQVKKSDVQFRIFFQERKRHITEPSPNIYEILKARE